MMDDCVNSNNHTWTFALSYEFINIAKKNDFIESN